MAVVEEREDMRYVGEAGSVEAAGSLIRSLEESEDPSVLIVGMNLPALGSFEVLDRATRAGEGICVVSLGAAPAHRYLFDVLDQGAVAYVSKSDGVQALVDAVHAGATGAGCVVSPRALRHLSSSSGAETEEAPVTAREFEVLSHMARGESNHEIADDLHISPHTVKNHITSIFSKLDVDSRPEAIVWMWERDLVSPS